MSASILQFSSHSLIALAHGMRLRTADEAAGRCLAVSLDLTLAAHEQLGLATRVVKWRVTDDPHFVDHWAVMLDDDRVIDLTRVQVDGNARLVSRLADYPANYCDPRVYPAALLMHDYAKYGSTGEGRLSNRFMWTCGIRLLSHDLLDAARIGDVGSALSSLRESARFMGRFIVGCATRALDARARRLVDRLTSVPDINSYVSLAGAATGGDTNVFVFRRHRLKRHV
jgi:hypothetical protein